MPLLRNLLERHKVPYSIDEDVSEEEERSVALKSFAEFGWMKGSKERPSAAKDHELQSEKLSATENVQSTDSEDPGSSQNAEKEVVKPNSEQKEEAKEEKEKEEEAEKEKEDKDEKEKKEEKEENEKKESTEKDEQDQEEVDHLEKGETPDTESGSQSATSSGALGKSDRLSGCFFHWPRSEEISQSFSKCPFHGVNQPFLVHFKEPLEITMSLFGRRNDNIPVDQGIQGRRPGISIAVW